MGFITVTRDLRFLVMKHTSQRLYMYVPCMVSSWMSKKHKVMGWLKVMLLTKASNCSVNERRGSCTYLALVASSRFSRELYLSSIKDGILL